MTKRFVRVLAVLLLISLFPVVSYASFPHVNNPLFMYISSFWASLSVENGTLFCDGSAQSNNTTTNTTVTVTLQSRSSSSAPWTYVTSWSDTTLGIVTANISETYPAISGYQYRLYVECWIKDSNDNQLEYASKCANL